MQFKRHYKDANFEKNHRFHNLAIQSELTANYITKLAANPTQTQWEELKTHATQTAHTATFTREDNPDHNIKLTLLALLIFSPEGRPLDTKKMEQGIEAIETIVSEAIKREDFAFAEELAINLGRLQGSIQSIKKGDSKPYENLSFGPRTTRVIEAGQLLNSKQGFNQDEKENFLARLAVDLDASEIVIEELIEGNNTPKAFEILEDIKSIDAKLFYDIVTKIAQYITEENAQQYLPLISRFISSSDVVAITVMSQSTPLRTELLTDINLKITKAFDVIKPPEKSNREYTYKRHSLAGNPTPFFEQEVKNTQALVSALAITDKELFAQKAFSNKDLTNAYIATRTKIETPKKEISPEEKVKQEVDSFINKLINHKTIPSNKSSDEDSQKIKKTALDLKKKGGAFPPFEELIYGNIPLAHYLDKNWKVKRSWWTSQNTNEYIGKLDEGKDAPSLKPVIKIDATLELSLKELYESTTIFQEDIAITSWKELASSIETPSPQKLPTGTTVLETLFDQLQEKNTPKEKLDLTNQVVPIIKALQDKGVKFTGFSGDEGRHSYLYPDEYEHSLAFYAGIIPLARLSTVLPKLQPDLELEITKLFPPTKTATDWKTLAAVVAAAPVEGLPETITVGNSSSTLAIGIIEHYAIQLAGLTDDSEKFALTQQAVPVIEALQTKELDFNGFFEGIISPHFERSNLALMKNIDKESLEALGKALPNQATLKTLLEKKIETDSGFGFGFESEFDSDGRTSPTESQDSGNEGAENSTNPPSTNTKNKNTQKINLDPNQEQYLGFNG